MGPCRHGAGKETNNARHGNADRQYPVVRDRRAGGRGGPRLLSQPNPAPLARGRRCGCSFRRAVNRKAHIRRYRRRARAERRPPQRPRRSCRYSTSADNSRALDPAPQRLEQRISPETFELQINQVGTGTDSRSPATAFCRRRVEIVGDQLAPGLIVPLDIDAGARAGERCAEKMLIPRMRSGCTVNSTPTLARI